jgi:2-aminoadipate transaminase
VTAGSNQLLYLVSDTLLDPGDVVICGAPSYFVYMGTVMNLGARAHGVAVDEQGIVPEAVDDALRRFEAAEELPRVKAIYVTTYYDNPTGVTLPDERRAALVELARRWSRDRDRPLYVIEDAAYRELRYYGDDRPSLRSYDPDGETVIQAGTFSKSYSPGVRVGWGLLPRPLVEPVLAQKGNIDFGSPNFNQILMSVVLNEGLFDEHLDEVRDGYRAKLDATLDAADRYLGPIDGVRWVRPEGGLYVWLRLAEHIDTGLDGPLFDRAIDEGVMYVPGVYCHPTDGMPPARNLLRLSFGIQSPESIARGIEALGRAVRAVISG